MDPQQNQQDADGDYTALRLVLNAPPAHQSALLALSDKVEAFFRHGPDAAYVAFTNLQQAITGSTSRRRGSSGLDIAVNPDLGPLSKLFGKVPGISPSRLWMSPGMTTALVVLLACATDHETLHALATDQGRLFGGLPSLVSTRDIPSTSLAAALGRAKAAALGPGRRTTVMVVSLHDAGSLELAAPPEFFNFSHYFPVAVGPEGVVVWQAWARNSYQLDEYIRDGRARVRGWDEAARFAEDFDDLAGREEDAWTEDINALYKKLFLGDVNAVCGPDGPERPVTPRFKAWVRIYTLENVTYENVTKFRWVKD
ncbi:hypothetical protein B0J13DRAFT_202376 [Dactylonectria estremocensis]|uniref:Uncharacterized protein n=1 Tax=Dactylonectria estremocensis TaxID=1079267 RepID=A0A9P9CZH4_9HYPO|nr:hypothetical protein B0J13DRAFT_632309 [Dactylonectria estremocensis]KAH7112222.1 hypothetical protein B0J13DRAFT_631584 [Dactylonectria estremocensis]KAH7117164.1 hypothetical protein B0J13DRAFT_202376 [Dactylonectria estremocensis]